MAILLQKQDAETATDIPQGGASLANAEYTIKYFSVQMDINPEENGITPIKQWVFKTDEQGFSYFAAEWKVSGDDFYYLNADPTLPIGTITIQETKAPEGYLLNPEIFVRKITTDGTNQFVSTYNAPVVPEQVMKGSVELYKRDSESGNLLAGAVYGIYFAGNEVGRLTTDQNGYAKSDLLPYGDYVLQEITAPAGYVLDKTQHQFKIADDGAVVTITATDKNQMGQITGTKLGEVLTGSDFRLTEHGMMYAPIYEQQGLPDAVFEVYAKTDITTPDGTVKYTAGQLVDTVKTDATGKFVTKPLYLGTYVIREQTAPDGYVLDAAEHEVTLTYGGQNADVILSSVSVQNERQRVKITLKKDMEENAIYPNPEAYKDVQFGLYTAEDIIAIDGTVALEANSLLEIITLDDTLTGTTTMDLPIGSYYLQEIATNEAYILDDTRYPIEFVYAGQDIPIVEVVANDGKVISNNLIKGRVELYKESDFPLDIINQGFLNRRLANAEYGIYTVDGVEVGRLLTDLTGYAISELLPYGQYYLKEIAAPYGYGLNDTEYPFTISENLQVITITATDTPKIGKIVPTYNADGGSNAMSATPQTGDSSMTTYIACAVLTSGFIALAVLVMCGCRKKL